MILGALIDAGVALEDVRGALGSLAIARDTVWTETVVRGGISATKFNVRGEGGSADTHQHADEDEHVHASAESHRYELGAHRHALGQSHRHPLGESHRHESESHRPESASHRTLAEIFRLIDSSSLSGTAKDRTKHLFTMLGEAEAAIHGLPLDRVHLHEVGALDSIIDIAGTVFALEQLGVDRIMSSSLNVGAALLWMRARPDLPVVTGAA